MRMLRTVLRWIIPALIVLILFRTGEHTVSEANPRTVVQGDWIVSDVEVVENQVITLQGNLLIKDQGSLTLHFVNLTLEGQYQGQYRIEVEPGGSLYIYDSLIAAGEPAAPFAFTVYGTAFEMHRSSLSNVGWGPEDENLDPNALRSGQLGLYLNLSEAILDDNTISQNHIGIIDAGNGNHITNNMITDSTVHAIYIDGGMNGLISGNQVQHAGNASSLLRMRPGNNYSIRQNSFFQEIHRGVIETFASEGNLIEENQISGFGVGIALMLHSNQNLVRGNSLDMDETGIHVHGRNNQVVGNTIRAENYDYHTGIYLVYAYNTIVDGNTIIDCGVENGIMVRHSSYNAITNNTVNAGGQLNEYRPSTGLLLFNKSQKNIIRGNHFTGFQRGLGLYYESNNNLISGNQFDSSPHQEIIIDEASGNLVSANNFLGIDAPPYDDGSNQWDTGGSGNYWAAYSGSDADGNGIGDQPYSINPSGVDHAPLMNPLLISPATPPTMENAPEIGLPDLVGMSVNGTLLIENQTVNLNWIDVAMGGNLTLRNVTILTGGNPSGLSSLQVQSGGRLVIENSSLQHLEYGNGFIMLAHPGSSLLMKDSQLDGCGQEWWYGGLQILTNDFHLEGNSISGTMLRFRGVTGGLLLDNTINFSYQALVFDNSDTAIKGNTFDHIIRTALEGKGSMNSFNENVLHNIWGNGIHLYYGNKNLIQGNTVSNIAPGFAGMYITGNESTIMTNTVSQAGTGIMIDYAGEDVDMRMEGNQLSNCDTCLEVRANNGMIAGNKISQCTRGVLLEGKNNQVRSNMISGNNMGMMIGFGYYNNQIYDNWFYNSGTQAEDYGHQNQWDDGALGNYWIDYRGTDADGDGIGDIPYPVLPNGVDRFPRMLILPYQAYLPLLYR